MKLNTDVLNIIKEFTFHERKVLYRKNKNKMIQEIIDVDTISSFNEGDEYPHEIFVFQSALNKIQFQMSFCSTCGNYTNAHNIYIDTNYSDRLLCKCTNENYHHGYDNYLDHMDALENEPYEEDFDMDEFYYHHNMDGDEYEETHRRNRRYGHG